MTPDTFIARWKLSTLGERQAAQPRFLDMCELLDEPKPADVDVSGADYCFEKGAIKTSGRRGWCDVWKKGHFAWEYKGKGARAVAFEGVAVRGERGWLRWHRWCGGAVPWRGLRRLLRGLRTRVPATPSATCFWKSC
jgi:hypothetical protein